MRTYNIDKGKHRAPFHLPKIALSRTGCARFRVRFSDGCLVMPDGVDRYDFSKAVGLGVGDHHIESIRLGWRSNGEEIELSAYYYVDGCRHSDVKGELMLGTVKASEWVDVVVAIRKDTMFISAGKHFVRVARGEKHSMWPILYLLHPFFGGDQPSQADCTIEVDIIRFGGRTA